MRITLKDPKRVLLWTVATPLLLALALLFLLQIGFDLHAVWVAIHVTAPTV